jgi:hypothetical protein
MQCEHTTQQTERQGYMNVEKRKWNVDSLYVAVLQHGQKISEPTEVKEAWIGSTAVLVEDREKI